MLTYGGLAYQESMAVYSTCGDDVMAATMWQGKGLIVLVTESLYSL